MILTHIREQYRLSLGCYGRPRMTEDLGSSLIAFHSQNKTVAASVIAEKKVSGHRS